MILALFAYGITGAQLSDSLVSYDFNTQLYDTVLPVTFDETLLFDYTGSSSGSLGNVATLSLTPPIDSLFIGSDFGWPQATHNSFSMEDYPMRTVATMAYYKNDTLTYGNTYTMVSNSFALGTINTLYSNPLSNLEIRADSMFLLPAFDDSLPNPVLSGSRVSKVYFDIDVMRGQLGTSACLIKLEDPIGVDLGWIGMAYAKDDSYYSGKVFHKFSYPVYSCYTDSLMSYMDGEQMYNYGLVSNFSSNQIGVASVEALGNLGQSGSSMIYTDLGDYYTLLIHKFCGGYGHERIKASIFYSFKNVMDNHLGTPEVLRSESKAVKLFPNPCSTVLTVINNESNAPIDKIVIQTVTGQVIMHFEPNMKRINLNVSTLSQGVYLMTTEIDNKQISKRFVVY